MLGVDLTSKTWCIALNTISCHLQITYLANTFTINKNMVDIVTSETMVCTILASLTLWTTNLAL